MNVSLDAGAAANPSRNQRFAFSLDRRSHLPLARVNQTIVATLSRRGQVLWLGPESRKLRAEIENGFLGINLVADAIPQRNLQSVGAGLGVV